MRPEEKLHVRYAQMHVRYAPCSSTRHISPATHHLVCCHPLRWISPPLLPFIANAFSQARSIVATTADALFYRVLLGTAVALSIYRSVVNYLS